MDQLGCSVIPDHVTGIDRSRTPRAFLTGLHLRCFSGMQYRHFDGTRTHGAVNCSVYFMNGRRCLCHSWLLSGSDHANLLTPDKTQQGAQRILTFTKF